MPTVEEKFGRILSDRSAELTYIVRDASNDGSAKSAVQAVAPATHQGLKLDNVQVEEIGDEMWLGSARYIPPEVAQPDTGDSAFTFDTSGGTQHITQARQSIARYPSDAPDHEGAIGVTHDSVEGVDITVPVYQFSETHYKPAADVTLAYRGTLFNLTGKVNDGAFKGLAAGECLFLGASGSLRVPESDPSGGDWEITYRFAGSPNVTGLTVGTITGVNKKGWEYLWVRYVDAEDAAAHVLVKRPAAVYIERVYDDGDFGLLGIGT